MSEASTPAATAAGTEASAPSAAPQTTAAPAVQQQAPISQPAIKPWEKERELRVQRQTLKALGIDVGKKDDPSVAIENAKKKNESRKSERRDLRAQVAQLSPYQEAVKVFAQSALADVPEHLRETLKRVAGDDPLAIVNTVNVWKLSGAMKAPAATETAPADTQQAPLAAPAQSAPVQPAPIAAPAPGTVDVKAEYARLQGLGENHRLVAAQYMLTHSREILGG